MLIMLKSVRGLLDFGGDMRHAVLLALLWVGIAEGREITQYRTGADSCGDWVEARRVPGGQKENWMQTYVMGFANGFATVVSGKDWLEGLAAGALFALLDEYCEVNPKVELDLAIINAVNNR